MKSKNFNYKGATILVLQQDDWLDFLMQIKTTRLFHCTTIKGKIEDVTEEDAIDIWNRYYKKISKLDDAWKAKLKKHSRGRKHWQKKKKTTTESSEPVIRVIQP